MRYRSPTVIKIPLITLRQVKRKVTKARKMCGEACCTGEKIPVKNKDECDPNDIGLHFDNVKNMRETELYNLIQNLWKPLPSYCFPQHVHSNRHWRFNGGYTDEASNNYIPWLAYSAYFDGTFCIPCVLFGHNFGFSKLNKLFKELFTRWNGAPTRWSAHASLTTTIHIYSSVALQTFISQMNGKEKRFDERDSKKGSN